MITGSRVFLSVLVLAALLAQPAGAAIVDLGMTTLDTDTNLEWLDMSQSVGISAWSIINRVDPRNLAAAGWHHASFTQIADLFTHAGMIPPYNSYLYDYNYAPAVALMNKLGATGSNSTGGANVYIQAIAPDGAGTATDTWHVPLLFTTTLPSGLQLAGGDIPSITFGFMSTNSRYAHWLIRPFDPATPARTTTWGEIKSRYRK